MDMHYFIVMLTSNCSKDFTKGRSSGPSNSELGAHEDGAVTQAAATSPQVQEVTEDWIQICMMEQSCPPSGSHSPVELELLATGSTAQHSQKKAIDEWDKCIRQTRGDLGVNRPACQHTSVSLG